MGRAGPALGIKSAIRSQKFRKKGTYRGSKIHDILKNEKEIVFNHFLGIEKEIEIRGVIRVIEVIEVIGLNFKSHRVEFRQPKKRYFSSDSFCSQPKYSLFLAF